VNRSAPASAASGGHADPAPAPPRFGALLEPGGVQFRVFTPGPGLALHVLTGSAAGVHQPSAAADGLAEFFVAGARAGDRYQFSIDGGPLRPDPASRFQPAGVHGPSEIVDAHAYRWQHTRPKSPSPAELVLYELHVGTFTREGTFAALRERLPVLQDLGVTAIELMPVADFPGTRNWGYDGVCLFAPSRNYGHPDDLRELVDAAHGLDLAVFLDVVYNHLGPEGAYLPQFCPDYITPRHSTPWGGAINLDGPGSERVRAFLLDNARHWIDEYRFDGLRLDATHALIDGSSRHIVAEITDLLHRPDRPVTVHGEDHRNLSSLVEPTASGGWGLDAVWADDFHHIVRRLVAGDAHGYYEDFSGTTDELASTLRQGWLYTGQPSKHDGGPRGSDASHVPMRQFVVCIQNHDQVGNRATGDRLHHQIDPAAWRAATAVLLTAPMTPLLFMGQEWAASAPFQFFTDLEPGLGRLVTEGRRHEFRYFPEFSDPEARGRIPDPQDLSTFQASTLDWTERESGSHRRSLTLYKDLLRLRRTQAAFAAEEATAGDSDAADDGAVVVRRRSGNEQFLVVVRLRGKGPVCVTDAAMEEGRCEVVLTTEDGRYALDPTPASVAIRENQVAIDFERPGAVIVKVG
jgi:maltooligosyltrehalose trehalohydrolase